MSRGKLFVELLAAGFILPAIVASSPPGAEGVALIFAIGLLGVLAFWWGDTPAQEIKRDKADEEREV